MIYLVDWLWFGWLVGLVGWLVGCLVGGWVGADVLFEDTLFGHIVRWTLDPQRPSV